MLSDADTRGKIVEWLWHLKKKGLAEVSIYRYSFTLHQLARECDVFNPEAVKDVISKKQWCNVTKAITVTIYNEFAKWLGLQWEPPIYKPVRKLPFIPTEKELDQFIAAAGPKLATFLQLLRETGVRKGEALKLRWIDVDFERKVIQVNAPEKGSNPRILLISSKLIAMLHRLPKQNERIFTRSIPTNLFIQRKRIARKLGNPRILQIHLHTLRHFFGTMQYHFTKDIIHVQQLLGHRDIKSTMLYIQLEQALFQTSDEFHAAVANTVEEACKLVEAGFEYVTEIHGVKIFRKRK